MAIAVSYFPVYEWTAAFLLCWLSLSSTTVETWTVWTVEQLLIESLLESSLKTVSTTPRQLHVVHQRPGWKTNGNWHLTTGSSQDLTLTTGWRPNWPLHCTPAVHQSIKISILLGPRCSSKQGDMDILKWNVGNCRNIFHVIEHGRKGIPNPNRKSDQYKRPLSMSSVPLFDWRTENTNLNHGC